MIKMGMSDEQKVLMNGPGRAPPDVESAFELRDDNAGLMAANRETLNVQALQVHTFAENLGPGKPVLFVLDCPTECGQ